jgi:peptide/nickel transport system substrate-binding protein
MDESAEPVLYHHDESMPPVEPGIFGFSRRSLLAGGGALAVSAFLAACSSDAKTAVPGTSGTTSGTTASTTVAGSTTTAAPVTTVSGGSSTTGAPGSSAAGAARTEAKTETITIGVPTLQEAFVDPHWTVGGLIYPLQIAIGEPLYVPNQANQLVPNLATGFDLSADQLTWTFKLRSGVKMHDGSDFTADDVKTAVDRILGSAEFVHFTNFRSFVTGATVVDPLTVSLTTNKPYATLVMDTPWPIATEYFKRVGDAKFKTNPVAAGPWKFVSQELNANVKYERHEDYFDSARKPNWKKLVYAIVPDESSRLAGIQTGALDIAYGLTAASADGLKGNSEVTVNENPGTGLCYCMMYDNAIADVDSPLKDLRVRKALLMAVDRDSIAKTLYKGFAKAPTSTMPTVTMGFNPDTKAIPYDAAGARQLLADAGHSDLSLTLNTYAATSTVPDIQKLAETIIAFWSAVGVKATLNAVDAATYLPQYRNKQLKGAALIAGPTSAYVEPARLGTTSFFWTKAPYTTIVGDAKLDGFIDQLNAELDADARATLGRAYGDYLDEQLYGLPMITVSSLVATGVNVASIGFVKGNPYAGPTSWIIAK